MGLVLRGLAPRQVAAGGKQEMQKRLQEMNDFMKSNAGSKEMADALQKARTSRARTAARGNGPRSALEGPG